MGVLIALGMGVMAFALWTYVSFQNDYLSQNRHLICLIDRLFGLDKPLTVKQLKPLRPIQLRALREIIVSCPKIGD